MSVRENSDWTQEQYVGKNKLLPSPSQHFIECNVWQSKCWWSTKTETCRPSPPPPTATRWTAMAATTRTTPPTTSSPATPGGTRTTPTPPPPRPRSSPSGRGRTRSWRGPRGSAYTSPSTTSSTFPWVRRYLYKFSFYKYLILYSSSRGVHRGSGQTQAERNDRGTGHHC